MSQLATWTLTWFNYHLHESYSSAYILWKISAWLAHSQNLAQHIPKVKNRSPTVLCQSTNPLDHVDNSALVSVPLPSPCLLFTRILIQPISVKSQLFLKDLSRALLLFHFSQNGSALFSAHLSCDVSQLSLRWATMGGGRRWLAGGAVKELRDSVLIQMLLQFCPFCPF